MALIISSTIGRFSRKPLILVSLGGYLLLNVIYAINAFWFYQLKVFCEECTKESEPKICFQR